MPSRKPPPPPTESLTCWEALDPEDPVLERARHLYETTLPAEERIPWQWIEHAVAARRTWRPGHWSPHLLLAGPRQDHVKGEPAIGFAYGAHVPGFGGYACYLGVDARHRGRGTGTRLLRLLVRVFQVDAACEGVPLPFVMWESRRPESSATEEERAVWRARLRLFAKVGAFWIDGVDFLAPNFARRQGPPVPLQLFLIPVDQPAEAFDAAALRAVAAALHESVYGRSTGDPLFERTLPTGSRPVLRPAAEADAVLG
jgi:GNAT superfamily N-acetyltransferase